VLASSRRLALKTVATLPESLQPLAEQAAWSVATFGVETARYVRRARVGRRQLAGRQLTSRHPEVHHSVDFSNGADLVALGLGWEYLDHESMYLLRRDFGVRIHMPAFDLIPISMPQMNAGQSHLVHRYYAEMAHYADSITSISFATQRALEEFFTDEELPTPHLSVNQLPGIEDSRSESGTESESTTPRHRFVGERYVLSVSTIEVRKNHVLLAKLWAECIREGVEMPKLVLVGRYGWDIDELRRWVDYAPELQDSFVICADVEDDELIELYRDALFTVFPSRIEGWGLPITESLGYGKVCIHSTDPAQLEASQGLMPALHPDDLPNWKSEVLRMVNDDEHRGALEARIASQFQMRTPAEYCATFEEILATRRASSEQP
jgi:glycosyltransferase involved in cell wall biosynthesis